MPSKSKSWASAPRCKKRRTKKSTSRFHTPKQSQDPVMSSSCLPAISYSGETSTLAHKPSNTDYICTALCVLARASRTPALRAQLKNKSKRRKLPDVANCRWIPSRSRNSVPSCHELNNCVQLVSFGDQPWCCVASCRWRMHDMHWSTDQRAQL